MKIKLIAAFFVCSIHAFSQNVTVDSIKASKPLILIAKPKLALLNKKSYSIEIPKDWKISESCLENQCSLFSPSDTIGVDIFTENINITVEKLSSAGYTSDQYAAFSIGYLPTVVKNFKLMERKKIKPNVTMVLYKGLKNSYNQTWKQYYYVKNAKVYIVTFACETPKYGYYMPIVEPALKSFKLL